MKRFILIALACLFWAGTASAREVTQGLVQGKGDLTLLFNIVSAEITGTGTCLNVTGGVSTVDSVACEDPAINEFQASRNAKVELLVTTVTSTGDSGYVCVFVIEVNGTAAGTALVTGATALEGVQVSQRQNFTINAGDGIGIMVGNTGGGNQCGDTADPAYSVQLYGRFLDSDA